MGSGLGLAVGEVGLGFDLRSTFRRNRLLVSTHLLSIWRRLMPVKTDTFETRSRTWVALQLGSQWRVSQSGVMFACAGASLGGRQTDVVTYGATRADQRTSATSQMLVRPVLDLGVRDGALYVGLSVEAWKQPAAYFSIGVGWETTR
jgi:hypothetical protein